MPGWHVAWFIFQPCTFCWERERVMRRCQKAESAELLWLDVLLLALLLSLLLIWPASILARLRNAFTIILLLMPLSSTLIPVLPCSLGSRHTVPLSMYALSLAVQGKQRVFLFKFEREKINYSVMIKVVSNFFGWNCCISAHSINKRKSGPWFMQYLVIYHHISTLIYKKIDIYSAYLIKSKSGAL